METENQSHSDFTLITEKCVSRLNEILDFLNVDYRDCGRYYCFPCPIHNGQNPNGLMIYKKNGRYPGRFKCNTRHCETKYGGSFYGFIKSMLELRGISSSPTKFCLDFLGESSDNFHIDEDELEKRRFIEQNYDDYDNEQQKQTGIPREVIRSQPKILPFPLLDEGFSPQVLSDYDVSLCLNKKHHNYCRYVVPIYDESGNFLIGWTARTILNKCENCQLYHSELATCPSSRHNEYSKWRHSDGFDARSSFYNLWVAKPIIKKNKTVIIVESPRSIWRLAEAKIKNTLAVFGSSLRDGQMRVLDRLGVRSLIVCLDSDEAGQLGAKSIKERCERLYRLYFPSFSAHGIDNLSTDEITSNILPILNEVEKTV